MKQPKILVLEDASETSILLMHLLESAGYDVILASEGKEAIKIALREQPELRSRADTFVQAPWTDTVE